MLNEDDFRALLDQFNRPWSGYKKVRKGVQKRLRRHMRSLGASDVDAYQKMLRQDPLAKRGCERCLEVTISRFFRDRKLWPCLQRIVLPALASRHPEGIRGWSIGCGCGEEVYSLALLWDQVESTVPLKILATDSNSANLQRASEGCYSLSSLKEVPESIVTSCFEKQDSGNHTILPCYKTNITWLEHNLFYPLDERRFSLIFLRNSLLTYYQGKQRNTALNRIIDLLEPKGYLVIGAKEKLPDHLAALTGMTDCPFTYQLAEKKVCR